MNYQKLRILSYDSQFNLNEEYEKRFNSYSTIHTGISIFPFLNEQKVTSEKYELFYVPLPSMIEKAEKIKYNSEKLRKLSTSAKLPGIAQTKIFLSTMIDEIQSTNETEGIESTKYEIAEAIVNRETKNKSSKKRFEGIVNMYLNLNEMKFEYIKTKEDLKSIYVSLFDGESDIDEWPDGEFFRAGQVELKSNEKVVHRGVTSESEVNSAVTDLINFMNRKDLPFIEKCITAHYYLEYIHPFYDGNGRLGRFIMSSYLVRKLDPYSGLSISNAVNTNRAKYYKAFTEVSHPRNKGEMTHFILDLMDLIISGQEISLLQLEEAEGKIKHVLNYLDSLDDLTPAAINILFTLIQDNLFSMFTNMDDSDITVEKDISRYKLNPILKDLEEKGYIEKIKLKPSTHVITKKVIDEVAI